MVFLRSPFAAELPQTLRNGPVVLRVPQTGDYEDWAQLRMESREFLTRWEPSWPHDDLTRLAFRSRIKRYMRDIGEDSAYPYFVFSLESGQLMGALTLSNVRRGAAQMASLG
jgi:ribosomal-protein-alanine N-acetyltransferase